MNRLFRDDCERLEEEICPQEYEAARSQNLIGREKEQILPNCRDLPNDEDKCLRVVNDGAVADTSSCYVGNGKTYRGVAATTVGGHRCQSWSEASKKHPLFSPAKYPELKSE